LEKNQHYNKVDEVDRTSFIDACIIEVFVDSRGNFAKLEPQIGEWNTIPLKIPKSHGKGANGFYHPNNSVGVENKLPINKPGLGGMTRWPK
jgi:hypothetical protein